MSSLVPPTASAPGSLPAIAHPCCSRPNRDGFRHRHRASIALATASHTCIRAALLATLSLCFSPVAGSADILPDGDFDNLSVGSKPDNGVSIGAWSIGVDTAHPEYDEENPHHIAIVPTNSFDDGAVGNSLHFTRPATGNHYAIGQFSEPIEANADEIVRFSFDAFVPETESSGQPGFHLVMLGEKDNFKRENRGPQFGLLNGHLVTNGCGPTSISCALMEGRPVDVWQNFQIDIDLNTDRYDLFLGNEGGTLDLVSPKTTFRGSGLDSIDRISVTHFRDSKHGAGSLYLDNFNVEILQKTPGDANLDGEVNFSDFLTLSEHFGEGTRRDPRAWSQGDFDGNNEVGFPDFLILSENFGGAANASAAAIPEPTGISIALFGLLGLIGFRKRR